MGVVTEKGERGREETVKTKRIILEMETIPAPPMSVIRALKGQYVRIEGKYLVRVVGVRDVKVVKEEEEGKVKRAEEEPIRGRIW